MIQLRFISEAGIVPKIIKMVTWVGGYKDQWSHVEICLPGNEGFVSSYDPGGVNVRPLDYCNPKHMAIGTVDCTTEIANAIFARAKSRIGTKYDYGAVIGDLLHVTWDKKDSFDCSAFVTWCFMQDLPLLDAPTTKWINPNQLYLSPLVKPQIIK